MNKPEFTPEQLDWIKDQIVLANMVLFYEGVHCSPTRFIEILKSRILGETKK